MFIQINGRILDEGEYKREIILLKRLIEYELTECSRRYGFERRNRVFVHKETGLKAKLVFEEQEWKEV